MIHKRTIERSGGAACFGRQMGGYAEARALIVAVVLFAAITVLAVWWLGGLGGAPVHPQPPVAPESPGTHDRDPVEPFAPAKGAALRRPAAAGGSADAEASTTTVRVACRIRRTRPSIPLPATTEPAIDWPVEVVVCGDRDRSLPVERRALRTNDHGQVESNVQSGSLVSVRSTHRTTAPIRAVGGHVEVEFVFDLGLAFVVAVVDAAGRAVPDAIVCAIEGEPASMCVIGHADSDGRMVVDDVGPHGWIGAHLPGGSRSPYRNLRSLPYEDRTDGTGRPVFTLRLDSPSASLAGVVVDGDGRPLAAAEVTVGFRSGAPIERVDGELLLAGVSAALTTGDDGAFESAGLPVGPNEVSVVTASGRRARFPIELTAGPNDAVFRLPVGVTVRGRVVSSSGEPVGGAQIRAVVTPDAASGPIQVTTSRDDGTFDVILPVDTDAADRRARLEARHQAEGRAVVDAPLDRADDEDYGVELRLNPSPTVRGIVVDARGEPVADVRIGVEGLDQRWLVGARGNIADETSTDAQGRFTVPRVDFAPIEVHAYPPSDRGVFCAVHERFEDWRDRDLVIQLPPAAGAITGVVATSTGRPAGGAYVRLRRQGAGLSQSVATRATMQGARFEFVGVPTGVYELYVTHRSSPVLQRATTVSVDASNVLDVGVLFVGASMRLQLAAADGGALDGTIAPIGGGFLPPRRFHVDAGVWTSPELARAPHVVRPLRDADHDFEPVTIPVVDDPSTIVIGVTRGVWTALEASGLDAGGSTYRVAPVDAAGNEVGPSGELSHWDAADRFVGRMFVPNAARTLRLRRDDGTELSSTPVTAARSTEAGRCVTLRTP